MRTTPTAEPLAHAADEERDWTGFLKTKVIEDWRPGEWFADQWLFIGDPNHPETRVFICATPSCTYVTDVRKDGRCPSCRSFQRENSDPAALIEHVKTRTMRRLGDQPRQCVIERDGDRCARNALSASGFCKAHYYRWKNAEACDGVTFDEFAELGTITPYSAHPECAVDGCHREKRSSSSTLCTAHREQHRKQEALWRSEQDFAARAIPIPSKGSFCLANVPEPLRTELLVAVQMEAAAGYIVDPAVLARLSIELPAYKISLADPDFLDAAFTTPVKKMGNRASFLRRASLKLRQLRFEYDKADPTEGDVWDTYIVGLDTARQRDGKNSSLNGGRFATRRGTLDFTPIRQQWLRELVKQWTRDVRPTTDKAKNTVVAFSVLSDAIALRPNQDDPMAAGVRDIQKLIELINRRRTAKGAPYSAVARSVLLTKVRRVLHHLRSEHLMDDIPSGFTVTPEDKIKNKATRPEQASRGVPYRVVSTVSAAIASLPLAAQLTGAHLSVDEANDIRKVALRVLVDTGRRPDEVCSLKVGCVTKSVDPTGAREGVQYTLTYDNHKAGRMNRVIPITSDTAQVILDWEQRRAKMPLMRTNDGWLFPSLSTGRRNAADRLTVVALAGAMARLVQSIPRLEDDVPDPATGGYLAFTGKIELYSFRHAYAQRHADAGVEPDTLRELMDHVSISTTMGYYRVSAQRKRDAIEKVAPYTVDWHGMPAPMVSGASYEIGSVAVPWGNCTEPSNVKAGGQSCPIRFRCSGCSMFRPDPSFLPGMKEHVTQLRSTLAIIELAGSAAPWVLQSMREEIAGYVEIMASMETQLAALPDEERLAVDEAGAALRKVRSTRTMLPLTVKRTTNAN